MIPGPARIEQFTFDSRHGDLGCKNCGEQLTWALNTGRSELLEMLEAVEVHQCNSEQVLRKAMLDLANELTGVRPSEHPVRTAREAGEMIQQRIWSLDPEPEPDDD